MAFRSHGACGKLGESFKKLKSPAQRPWGGHSGSRERGRPIASPVSPVGRSRSPARWSAFSLSLPRSRRGAFKGSTAKLEVLCRYFKQRLVTHVE